MVRTAPRKVVAGIGPDTSTAVMDFAAEEAALRGVPLRMLAMHPLSGPGPRDSLTAVLRRVCTAWPGVTVTARNVTGEPGPLLIAASRQAGLLVVGRDRAGSCAAQVAAHALCPTVVVPHRVTRAGGPVLVGLAAEPDEEPLIEFAFEAADLRRVPLVAAHVWAGLPVAGSAGSTPSPTTFSRRTPRRTDWWPSGSRGGPRSSRTWRWTGCLSTTPTLPRPCATPAPWPGLVVVGARRAGAYSGQLLGPVTRTLLAAAGCPVAVLRLTRPGLD